MDQDKAQDGEECLLSEMEQWTLHQASEMAFEADYALELLMSACPKVRVLGEQAQKSLAQARRLMHQIETLVGMPDDWEV